MSWTSQFEKLQAKKPAEVTLSIPTDAEAAIELQAAQAALIIAENAGEDITKEELEKARKRVSTADKRVNDTTVWLRFRGISAAAVDNLRTEYTNANGELNTDSYTLALLAACHVPITSTNTNKFKETGEPGMTVDQAGKLRTILTDGDWKELLAAAFTVTTSQTVAWETVKKE